MRLRSVLFVAILALLAVLAAIVGIILISDVIEPEKESSPVSFSVLETGAAADYAYAVYSFRGDANLTILGYESKPTRTLVIINDSQAVEAGRLPELASQLAALERYGYNVTVTDEQRIGEGIYVLPAGAMPTYALFNLQQNSSNGTIIYIGGRDLILSNGIKRLPWYDSLSEQQRARLVIYNGTLEEFMEAGNVSLPQEILHGTWMLRNQTSKAISGDGLGTAAVWNNRSGYMRIVYEFEGHSGIFDSPYLEPTGQDILPEPQVIYPWEKSSLEFDLNRTNGTAFFSVKKDGKVVEHEQLRRVTDENVFLRKLEYSEPGEYVLLVNDNSGTIASGMLHVKDLAVRLAERRGYAYIFAVSVDGMPLENAEAQVSVGNSSKKKFFVSEGQMVVNAKLDRGVSVFDVEIGGAHIPVQVDNQEDPVIEFYLKYGTPALALVLVVYFGARVTRRPSYKLRFGDSADYVRQEIVLPVERALESFLMIRGDMKLGQSPITPHEFSISLKRYLTNGAEVTEGNVEEILKKLVKAGRLDAHRNHYQMSGEGDVVRNTLRRMVREKLIESGTPFTEEDGKFVTKDFEIGFYGASFRKKGIIVVDDKAEEKRILAALSDNERARLRIMQSNDSISFVSIDRLSDVL